jgi:hypothetical protein
MALVARPLAHSAGRQARLMIRAVTTTALLALFVTAAPAQPIDVELGPYLAAFSTSNIGTVSGRVYEERRRPRDPDHPLASTVVMLVPRSAALVQRLEALRRAARESAAGYRAAAPGIRQARDEYETALWQAGAPHLAPVVATGDDGSFRIADVPAGAWLLIAWHADHQGKTPKRSPREERLYAAGRRLIGFDAVQVWVRDVTVARGTSEPEELNDRNVWFNGVEEDTMLDAGR